MPRLGQGGFSLGLRLNDHGITNRASVTRYIEEIGNATGPALRVTVGTIHTATVEQDMPRSTSAAEDGNGEGPNMYTRKPGITLI